jgi:hypothetical protein
MKRITSFDRIYIINASDGYAMATNEATGEQFLIRYSNKRKEFIESNVGKRGQLQGTSYDNFIQVSSFFPEN